jgi:hypothetical protein
MAPIFVNVPGSGDLDTAGRGVAAAQQYRGNEQKMRSLDLENKRRDESMAAEVGLATRKLDIEEADMQFQREQLAQQQEAAGDLLVAQAKLKGPLDPQKERALRLLSPDTQQRLLYAEAQGERVRAEQATIENAMMGLERVSKNPALSDKAAELQAQIDSGAMTPRQAATAVASLVKENARIEHVEKQREVVLGNVDTWVKDPTYDMPPQDDDAHDDVVELYEKLSPNAEFDPNTNYQQLWDQYKFLTTKGMREASRALLEADLKKKNMVPVDMDQLDALMESASKDPEFREKAGATYGQAEAFTDRVAGPMRRMLGGGKAGAAAGEAGSSGGAQQPKAADAAPGSKLKEPMGQAERKQMYGAPDTDLQTDFMQALQDMGFTSIPQPGDPEYGVARDVMKALKAKRAAQATKPKAETIEDAANRTTRGTMQ